MLGVLLGPIFADVSKYGLHDWDSSAAYRYISVLSIKRYHEFPFWHPFLCGGFPAWAFAEGATNVVSPYLPFYLLLPLGLALRIEVLGSAITGLLFAYLFASRFTQLIAGRLLVAVLFALNGRFTLQMANGHAWHLQYAWLPLALFFADRATTPGHPRDPAYAGMVVALMVYMGGIYPAPHAALALFFYAVFSAVLQRSGRPLVVLALTGLFALCFSAPKLLPLLHLMTRFPRAIASTEAIGPQELWAMLAGPLQGLRRGSIAVPAYGWHEWGCYVGPLGAVLLGLGLLLGCDRRTLPLRLLGAVFVVLTFGAFSRYAPWTLLHSVPPFSSQHVPSRFLYPAVLFLACSFVSFVDRRFGAVLRRRAWLDLILLIPVGYLALNIATVGRASTSLAFSLTAAKVTAEPSFRQLRYPAVDYVPKKAWAGPSLLAMYANTGFIECYSVPERGQPRGALAADDPRYRGEVAIANGTGEVTLTAWTPNSAVVRVQHASPGSLVVYNMNYDPDWRADGHPALEYEHAVAAPSPRDGATLRFSYFPRMLPLGVALFLLACLLVYALPRCLPTLYARGVSQHGHR
jgi:hypothetical protein